MYNSHPTFNRFWRHYEASMVWMRAHYATVSRINAEYMATVVAAAAAGTAHSSQRTDQPTRQKSPRGPSNSKRRKFHSPTASTSPRILNDDNNDNVRTTMNVSTICDGHVQAYEVNQGGEYRTPSEEELEATGNEDISDAILDFFETSRRHREQRDLEESQRHYENLENLMISTRPSAVNSGADTSAMFEACQREMKELYGSQAATIHGMEMAMQCGFERFAQADVKLWPNIPMRL